MNLLKVQFNSVAGSPEDICMIALCKLKLTLALAMSMRDVATARPTYICYVILRYLFIKALESEAAALEVSSHSINDVNPA